MVSAQRPLDGTPDTSETAPPSYDTNKKNYAGISEGELHSTSELRSARDFAEMIVDTVREGLLVLDFDLRIQAANESFYNTFRVPSDEAVGRIVYELGDGQWDLPGLRTLLGEILPANGIMNDYEVEHVFEHIGHRVMLLNARQMDDHELILLAIEDVTDRRRAERIQRDSEESLRQLAHAVPDLVWIAGDNGVVEFYSDRAKHYHGLNRQEDGSWEWGPVVHPDELEQTVEAWQHAMATGEPYEIQHRLRMVDGSYRWHVSRALPHRGPSGQVVKWYGTVTDINQLKQAEQALRASEQRFRNLFLQAPAFIAVVRGPEHRFEFLNAAYLQLVGERDLLGKTIREALPEIEGQGLLELLDTVYRDNAPVVATDRTVDLQRTHDGPLERRYLDFVYQPLRESDGSVSGVITLGVDTTDRVRSTEALARAHQDLERSYNELERRVDDRTQQVRQLSRALTLAEQDERQRIAHVLHDDLQQILFAASLQVSSANEELGIILQQAIEISRSLSIELCPPLLHDEDLEDLLRWTANQARQRHSLDVEVEVSLDAPVVEPSLRILVYQFVRELLFNIAKHASTNQAWVRAFRVDGNVRISVIDKGVGFDPAVLEDPSRLGLGLSSVRERAELVGGRLDVESAPGSGTRVTITIPVESGEASEG